MGTRPVAARKVLRRGRLWEGCRHYWLTLGLAAINARQWLIIAYGLITRALDNMAVGMSVMALLLMC